LFTRPLEVYRRINNISQAELNRRIGEYATRNVTWDYTNRANFMPYINRLYPFVTVYNGVAPEPVNAAAGHWRIPDALAPGDYGYNKIRLVPSSDGALIRMRLRGHVNSAAQSGWTFGFVAIGSNGAPRYGPLTSSSDATVSFQLQPGEQQVYLVVTSTPGTVHKYAFLTGFPRNYRHPYQFRIEGAVPYGFEPGHTKPTPTGGRWHSNGGGWVDNRANVAATAYVGPRAAVFGNSTVTGNARIEGLSWVNSGATVGGNVIVKDSALVQGGSNLSGSAVIGGDAEPFWACSSGTYMMFVPDRQCDGRVNVPGEADINPPYTLFTDAQMAIDGVTDPDPTPSPTPSPTASPTQSPPPGPGGCTASYTVVGQWQDGFQADVTVTAGSSAISGWRVTWTFANGQTITQYWGAAVASNGASVTADNVSWNGAPAAGASTTFGLIGSSNSTNSTPTLTCTPR
jgi:hypothetical protein